LLRAHFIENIECINSGSFVLVAKPKLLKVSFLEVKKIYLETLQKCSSLK